MVLVEASKFVKNQNFVSIFIIVLISIMMTGAAFTASFLFNDLFIESLRRCNIYDSKCPEKSSMKYMLLTHTTCIIVVTLVVTIAYHILKRW